MAVRGKNAHWKVTDIQRRHWVAVGTRHGVVTLDGQPADALLDDLAARTPEVIARVRPVLPEGFPQALANSILQGLELASQRLRA